MTRLFFPPVIFFHQLISRAGKNYKKMLQKMLQKNVRKIYTWKSGKKTTKMLYIDKEEFCCKKLSVNNNNNIK